LKPGKETAYGELEADTARICARLGCPHPYLAIKALTGPKEVWFFNGYNSWAEQKQMVEDYAKNAALMEALMKKSRRKASLTRKPVEVLAIYREELRRGAPWSMSLGRFLITSVTKGAPRIEGAVFEAPDGTKFVLMPAKTREEADAKARAEGSESRVLAVRPTGACWPLNGLGRIRSFGSQTVSQA